MASSDGCFVGCDLGLGAENLGSRGSARKAAEMEQVEVEVTRGQTGDLFGSGVLQWPVGGTRGLCLGAPMSSSCFPFVYHKQLGTLKYHAHAHSAN